MKESEKMEKIAYRDTRNYAPIDVTKGMDLLTKKIVMADADAPEGYEPIPKCKLCKKFTETDTFMGTCEASMNEPKFIAYPDMVATTCEMYETI